MSRLLNYCNWPAECKAHAPFLSLSSFDSWGLMSDGKIVAWAEVNPNPPGPLLIRFAFPSSREMHIIPILIRELLKIYSHLTAQMNAPDHLLFINCGGTLLALNPTLFLICWANANQLQAAHFRWPTPPLQQIQIPDSHESLNVLRLDLIHPLLGGNKWFKLWGHLQQAKHQDATHILSFGGAWSNHLLSLAAAGQLLGYATVGVIRGEKPIELTPVLKQVQQWGMELIWISRHRYRQQRESERLLSELQAAYPHCYWIPEGGASAAGMQGLAHIWHYLPVQTQLLAAACGTGTTLAGMMQSAPPDRLQLAILGVPVLKGDFLAHEWQRHTFSVNWELDLNHHFGGYARITPLLTDFLSDFHALNPHCPLEPVYTGKLMAALHSRVRQGQTLKACLALHTGGVWPWQGHNTRNVFSAHTLKVFTPTRS